MIESTLQRRETTESSFNRLQKRSLPFAKLRSGLVATFVTITTLVIFIPLNPDMPDKGIDQEWFSAIKRFRGQSQDSLRLELPRVDPSWTFALNAAVARHLRFGKQVMFTGGPYASIYTRSFHPSTDRLMMFGSFVLGLSFALAVLYLADRKPYTVIALILFCATFPQRDALLLSYPFILVICALKFSESDQSRERAPVPWRLLLGTSLALSALGLLPLIKGSLLVPAGLAIVLLGAILFSALPRKLAIPLFLVAPLASVVFWIMAGQSPVDIPDFVRGTMWLTSGYTDAMSLPWLAWPAMIGTGFVIAYLAACALIYVSLFRSARLSSRSRWILVFLSAVFFLIAFKHGFVRSDHLVLSFISLTIVLFTLNFLYVDRYIIASFVFVVVLVIGISFRQDHVLRAEVRQSFGVGVSTDWGGANRGAILTFIWKKAPGILARVTYENTVSAYTDAWEGLRLRLLDGGSLQRRFEIATANIRKEYTAPVTTGTVDIYSYEQAIPLASGADWSPRPVLQSYSAYTPALEKIDEQHLRGASAPDWVLLDLLAIDGRLPSLEDGLSWPALLDNYAVSSFDGQIAVMHKNEVIRTNSSLDVIYQNKQSLGSTITLPEADGPLFAEIDIKPTMLGRLLTALFNPPQLGMVVHLRNGSSGEYRVVSDMMRTGFILSPLVRNTSDFVSLATGDKKVENAAKVDSISIAPSYGGSIFWAGEYRLTLKTYRRPITPGE
jgi:hypothetical protein